MLHTQRPVRVLFDDYGVRDTYRLVENVVEPSRIIGRMAEFTIQPGAVAYRDASFLVKQFFQMTVHGEGEKAYRLPASGA
jgi:hypothetical protein